MIDVTLDSKNFRSFAKNLKGTVNNLTGAWVEIDNYQKKKTEQQFQNETDPEGNKWSALSPRTLATKSTNTILRETGKMYKSQFSKIDKSGYQYGIRDPKYRYHHEGTSKMPARVVVGFSDKDRQFVNEAIRRQIKRTRKR